MGDKHTILKRELTHRKTIDAYTCSAAILLLQNAHYFHRKKQRFRRRSDDEGIWKGRMSQLAYVSESVPKQKSSLDRGLLHYARD